MITLRSKREDITIHLLILMALAILTVILFFKFSTEDSYITYRYAQNMVDGHGFVYNPGEEFLGTTAPFYGLILAFFGFLGFSIPAVGGILSALSLGMSVILIYLLTLKKGYPWVGFLCGLFVLLNPWFLQTFGSETYFQLLMIISALYFYDKRKYIPTTIFCVLAFLVRADGIIPAGIIFLDYIIKNKKFPTKEALLFIILCIPFFLFCYFNFNTFLPNTLETKQAQYVSDLWRKFFPGIFYFAGVILKENTLFYSFIPLLLAGGTLILFSQKVWFLIASWATLHTLGYTLLKVSFYHWYAIPLILLLMLISAFSIQFITSVPLFFKENQMKKWNFKIFNQEIKISLAKFKDIGSSLKWTHRILSLVIISCILLVLSAGIRAYHNTYRSFPFPKLELYTKAGRWISKNTPADASVAALEVGYLGYYSQRKIIDLVGIVTPGVSTHIRKQDFQWAVKTYKPDYFVYCDEFRSWLETITDQPWFEKSYRQIKEMNVPGYSFELKIFKKVLALDLKEIKTLIIDSQQEESNFAVGEITEGVEIGQTFYCSHNHLTRIKVMLATFKRKNNHEVIFHLKKSPADNDDIYTERFDASSILDNAYRSFDFPPIPDSKGKSFYFSLESPHSKTGDAITAWAMDANRYHKGALYINRKKSKGDLRFKTYCYDYSYEDE
jgi:hypothetical protein